MRIEDFRQTDNGSVHADLCIVGSGPAGLTIAKEFGGSVVDVLILESGGLDEDPKIDTLSEFESIGAARIMEPTLVRNRIFGGTSHSWSGRCAPFDDIDFQTRPWVPFSGWPIQGKQLVPHFERAMSYLGLGANRYDASLWTLLGRMQPNLDVDMRLLKPVFWQFSKDAKDPLDYMRFGRRFLSAMPTNVRVLLHATAIEIRTDQTGTKLDSLEIGSPEGKRATVKPRALVLCAGGIENARLLLSSNRGESAGVGNRYDVVGRFLMDHPRFTLAEFEPLNSRIILDRYGLYRLSRELGGHSFQNGLGLSPDLQRNLSLLNCAAWFSEDRSPDDPWDAVKRLLTGRDRDIVRDIRHIMCQPHFILEGLHRRFVRRQEVRHKLKQLRLDCVVEQRPDPDSRVRLSRRVDPLGVPLPQVDWKVSEQEKRTVATLGRVISGEFKRIGLPLPILSEWIRIDRPDQAEFIDAAHPTGTTRMSTDPRHGVVDQNCRVHGLDAIFIAGSSIFPTSSHANPTLMIVALAIRLADWLKTHIFHPTT